MPHTKIKRPIKYFSFYKDYNKTDHHDITNVESGIKYHKPNPQNYVSPTKSNHIYSTRKLLLTFVISWWSVLLVEETGVLAKNHQPVASH
jgi:hypothetical protein